MVINEKNEENCFFFSGVVDALAKPAAMEFASMNYGRLLPPFVSPIQ